MRKKLLSSLLALTMVVTMFAGCGGGSGTQTSGDSQAPSTTSAEKQEEVAATAEEGKVLNIYCFLAYVVLPHQ